MLFEKTRHEPLSKTITAKVFWWFANSISDRKFVADQAALRIFTKKVRNELVRFREPHKLLAGIFSWVGFRQSSIDIEQEPRTKGVSKYSYTKRITQTLTAVTGFSDAPFKIMAVVGITLFVCSFLVTVLLLGADFLTAFFVPGWTFVIMALLFVASVQFVCFSMVFQYLSRMYQNTLHRPEYIVDKLLATKNQVNDD